MSFNCPSCGAPINSNDKECPYCGKVIRGGKGKSKFKSVSLGFMIFISIITLRGYSVYWYLTRRKGFNELVSGMKIPDIGVIIYILSAIFLNYLELPGLAFIVCYGSAMYMSLEMQKILKKYISLHCKDPEILEQIPLDTVWVVICVNYYIQNQINKMIDAEILSPQL